MCHFYVLFSDGRKDKNDYSNGNSIDERQNHEISSNSQNPSNLKLDQPISLSGSTKTPYRNVCFRTENCMYTVTDI